MDTNRIKQIPLRITFLLTQSLESPGGGGRYFPLARELVKQGHKVTIIALHHDFIHTHQRSFIRDDVRVIYVAQMHVRKIGNRKEYFSPPLLIWTTIVAIIKLTWAVLHTSSDIIHVGKTQPMNGIAAWFAHLLLRVPVFLDSDDYEAVNNRFSNDWQQRVVAWFENWMPSFANGITANTSFLVNYFQRLSYPADRIIWVPNGADRERFSILDSPDAHKQINMLRQTLGLNPQHRVIIYVGSMSFTSHAVDLLLDAFHIICKRDPNAFLLLVGSGEDMGDLKRMAASFGIEERLQFTGRVPIDDVPYYYKLGKVTVDPLRDSLPARSSLSLKLIESIAAGVPCVTADIGDRRLIVGKAGIAVPPNDVESLVEGILTILDNEDLANRMRRAAIQQRENLWWDVRINDFMSLYPR